MGCCCCRSKVDVGITSLWAYDPATRSIVWKRDDGRNGVNDPFVCNSTALLQIGRHIAQARTLTASAQTDRFVELSVDTLPNFMEEVVDLTAAGVNSHGAAFATQSLPDYSLSGGVAHSLYWYIDHLGNPAHYYTYDPPGAPPVGYNGTGYGDANVRYLNDKLLLPTESGGTLTYYELGSSTIRSHVFAAGGITTTTLVTFSGLLSGTYPCRYGSTAYVFKDVGGVVHLVSYSMTTGAEIADVETSLPSVNARGCAGDGFIWVRDSGNANIYCIDAATGNTLVSSSIPSTDKLGAVDRKLEHIADNGDFLYWAGQGSPSVTSHHLIRQSKATGAVAWRVTSSIGTIGAEDIAHIKTIDEQTYTKIRTSSQDRIAHIDETGAIVWQSPRGTYVSTLNQTCRLRSATRMADGKILMGGVLPQTPV